MRYLGSLVYGTFFRSSSLNRVVKLVTGMHVPESREALHAGLFIQQSRDRLRLLNTYYSVSNVKDSNERTVTTYLINDFDVLVVNLNQ